jgi:NAD(P)-dependent dehydrogenase (short-subunit alcohol dehydrogenase family)
VELTAMARFDGEVAIITGSAQGIGAAYARALAREGARVVVSDILDPAPLAAEICGAGGEALGVRADVTHSTACEVLVAEALERFGRVDVLVNNAAVDVIEPIGSISEAGWAEVLRVDLSGVLHASQAAARQMLAQGDGGSIINISSIASTIGIPGLGSYSAAKGGVNQLTRVMAVELASQGIRVNAIAPGYLENIMQGAGAEHANPETERRIQARTPLGRRAKLRELVGPVVFLASGAASYVTGAVLFVDGGYTAA